MSNTKENIEHSIQLKQNEITNCEKIGAEPLQLHKLKNELTILKNKLEDREGKREIKSKLGYSRIGLNNT